MNVNKIKLYINKIFNPIRHFGTSKTVNNFDDIPGPLSLPVLGTLYQYLPIIGQYN